MFFYTFPLPPLPDVPTFISLAGKMAHPYDTGFREPFFVWWCRLFLVFTDDPQAVFQALRLAGVFLFVGTGLLAYRVGEKALSRPVAMGACLLLAVNWSQVETDLNALRNTWEGFVFLALLALLLAERPRSWAVALVGAALCLLRITFFPVLAALLPVWYWRRAWGFRHLAWVLGLVVVTLLPHFANNRKISGDPFYSSNI